MLIKKLFYLKTDISCDNFITVEKGEREKNTQKGSIFTSSKQLTITMGPITSSIPITIKNNK